jgi:hypothetical protein
MDAPFDEVGVDRRSIARTDFSSMTRMFRCRELVGQIRIENPPTSRQMGVT